MKIRNINPEFGMTEEFASVSEMEAAIRELENLNGGEWMPSDGLKEGRDYEIVTRRYSWDNGLFYFDIDELENIEDEILQDWEAIVNAMDDETREQVHAELAPCSEIEFLRRYLELAPCDLIIG